MGIVRCDMSMSLDGVVGGEPGGDPYGDRAFGRVTRWAREVASWRERQHLEGGTAGTPEDEVMAEMFAQAGAYVMGRNMFDAGEEPWGPEPPFRAPVFVLTTRPREPLVRGGGTTFTFVPDGIAAAIALAREAAGDRDVAVSGGASTVQQALAAGLLDELHLHVAPVILGGGTRLFDDRLPVPVELERTRLLGTDAVTHVSFRRVARP